MKILALEPYFGGSHRAFLEGWVAGSRHDWTIGQLPPSKWKWRMRHSAVTFAEQAHALEAKGERFDLLFCSDMLNLAEFKGLAPASIACLPSVAYFHENQLTYPVQVEMERDFHFGLTNFTTALAATQVWFNSIFHQNSFLEALTQVLSKMPDHNCQAEVKQIRAKSLIFPQGISQMPTRSERPNGPARLLWAARWEHDKNPELFFEAIFRLIETGLDFRLSVLGEQFQRQPEIFDQAKDRLAGRIDHWGYLPSRADYEKALSESDIFVATANHEFFGISVVEAIAAGAYPLLPDRLAYPEILPRELVDSRGDFFYDGSLNQLVARLSHLIEQTNTGSLWGGDPDRGVRAVERFHWKNLIPELDTALEQVAASGGDY